MFFYLAKIVWILAQPSTLVAAALTAGTILIGTTWHRLARGLLLLGVLGLLIGGFLPLSELMLLPLENRFPRPELHQGDRIDGMIILGGAEDTRSNPPRELAALSEAGERFTEAVALARRFPNARLVFTGGSAALVATQAPEADTAGRLLEALGVAPDRVTLEARSRDTYENAAFTRALVSPKPGERWLLITSAWHMPRAMGCFRQAGFAVEAWPVDYRTSAGGLWRLNSSFTEGLRRIDFTVREYAGLVVYYMSGRSDALFPSP